MPNTRSRRAKKQSEVENQNKSIARTSAAKARSARLANKEPRQYLQNITNPKISGIAKVQQKQLLEEHNYTATKMGTDNSEDLSAQSAVVPLESKCAEVLVPESDMEARFKRKSTKSNDSGELQEIPANSPSKRLKEQEVALVVEAVNGLNSNDKVSGMDVNDEEVETIMQPVVVDDGEKPSTSKAAQAAHRAQSASSSPQTVAHDYIAAFTVQSRTPTTPNTLGSPSSLSCAERRRTKLKSPRKRHLFPDTTAQSDVDTSDKAPLSVSEKLLLVISNLYLNAGERLKLNFPPRCAEDLEHCHQSHYRAPLPAAPNHTQANNLRCALQQQRYVSFVNLSYDMCHRGEYPGVGILTKLIELVLSFNAKCYNNDSLGYFFNKSIELFSFIVRKFPPCWLSLRPFYIEFLQTPLNTQKISTKNEQPFKANKVLEILFELLGKTLEQCSTADLQSELDGFNNAREATTSFNHPTTPKKQNKNAAMGADEQIKVADLSQQSEYMNVWEWEVRENRLQTFEALKFPRIQLERVFISLQLLLQILEQDFVMWILHHHKKAKDWIFHTDSQPFTVLVFGMSKYTRSTDLVQKLFTLFAFCIKKRARRTHLEILERYIALIMAASNIADLEYSESGAVCYPKLGEETKTLIQNFFKLFKSHNGTHVPSYLSAIGLLRIPYVRYEFIDSFLHCFQLTSNEPMTPKKIANELLKKRWLKYKPKAELLSESNNLDDDHDQDGVLNREQYLMLLIIALKAYCDFHGLRAFFNLLVNDEKFDCFRFVTDSVHRYPIEGGKSLLLDRMAKNIAQLEKMLRMTVCMSKPKACLPLIDICISEDLLQKYRNDLKYVMILNNIIELKVKDEKTAATSTNGVDFIAWSKFLSAYTTDKK